MQIDWKLPRFQDLDLSELAANVAPLMVPAAPMTVAIIGLAQGLAQAGGLALIPAVLSGTGMELVGMLSAHLLTEAILARNWGRVFSSALLMGLYGVFAWWAISHVENSGMYAAFVCMSLVAYLGAAMYRFNHEEASQNAKKLEDERRAAAQKRQDEQDEEDRKLARREREMQLWREGQEELRRQRELDLQMEQEKTKQARAQAKTVSSSSIMETMETVETVKRGPRPENLERVRQYFEQNPNSSENSAAKALGLSPTTVGKCREWLGR